MDVNMTDLTNISEIEFQTGIDEADRNKNLLTLFKTWVDNVERSSSERIWREKAKECYRFYGGKQDTDAVLNKLAAETRPNSVFNEIKPKIDTLIGLAAQLKLNPSLLPTENTDEAIAEVLGTAFKFVRRQNKAEDIELECFEHTAKAGRSLQGHFVDTENPFNPVIKTVRVESGRYGIDPDSRDYPAMDDGRYMYVDKWLDPDTIKAFYPHFNVELSKDVENLSLNDSVAQIYFNENNNKSRVVEMWYRVYEKTAWFVNPLTGQPDHIPLTDWPDYVKALTETGIPGPDGNLIKLPEPPEMMVRPRKVIRFAIFSGDQILERGANPFTGYNEEHFPYSLYTAYRDDEEDYWFGPIEMMKDPQRGFNTIMRQLVHLLNTSPKGMLVHEEDAILNINEYKDKGSSANFDLKVKKGALSQKKILFTDQPQIPSIYQDLLTRYGELMKNLSGIQDVFLGISAGSREPGITSQLRQQSGLAVLFIMFDNFRRARIHSGKQLLSFIQQYKTATEFIRIDPIAAPVVINEVGEDNQILNDISIGKYDLIVEEALEGSSMKLANAKILTEFAQNNPGAIPPDILLDQTNVTSSAKQRVREFTIANQEAQQQSQEEENLIEWAKILEKADKPITPENINKARSRAKRKRDTLTRST
jgi:hypothetical protein